MTFIEPLKIGGMSEQKFKYELEYENSSSCFWLTEPAKYVRLLSDEYLQNIVGSNVLDLGAGEGKNAVYLAKQGAYVTAVDTSEVALSRFSLQPHFDTGMHNLKLIKADMTTLHFEQTFDIVIAYGVLHCLSSKAEVYDMLGRIKSWIKPGGYFVGATFTDVIPPPTVQEYLEFGSFLSIGDLERCFEDCEILRCEYGIIKETHSTTSLEHEHSIVRLIAKK
jgi:2-polyprenyl-3-methyl-5-hydroxy-6-metoxy-1,4-benzoquinol methylase